MILNSYMEIDELIDKYCLDNGRNAVSPIRMFKYLLLKAIFDLSDIDVVECSKYDMSFKYFLDMLISKTVTIAIEKGILKSKSILVDATHSKSGYNSKTPQAALQERSEKLRKAIHEREESVKEKFPEKNTEDSSFFGYKTHIAMAEERIIITAVITSGEKTYSSKKNIEASKRDKYNLISKLNSIVTQVIVPKKMNLNLIKMQECISAKQDI